MGYFFIKQMMNFSLLKVKSYKLFIKRCLKID